MRKFLSLLIIVVPLMLNAQDAEQTVTTAKSKPVKNTFENPVSLNNQTIISPSAKSLDFIIQHRFGVIKNADDLFGLYAPSNIRLGLTYGIIDRVSVGVGVTKLKMLYDFQWKGVILKQMKSGGSPVSVTYYGDVARSAGKNEKFTNQDNKYKGTDRLSFFHEVMVARKFGDRISVQGGATYSHINLVDTGVMHNYYGVSFLGRYRFSPQSSIIAEFDAPLKYQSEVTTTYPTTNSVDVLTKYYPRTNLGIGLEVSTSAHQFQIFVCTADAIVNQQFRAFNRNDWTKREVILGFNITRQWGF